MGVTGLQAHPWGGWLGTPPPRPPAWSSDPAATGQQAGDTAPLPRRGAPQAAARPGVGRWGPQGHMGQPRARCPGRSPQPGPCTSSPWPDPHARSPWSGPCTSSLQPGPHGQVPVDRSPCHIPAARSPWPGPHATSPRLPLAGPTRLGNSQDDWGMTVSGFCLRAQSRPQHRAGLSGWWVVGGVGPGGCLGVPGPVPQVRTAGSAPLAPPACTPAPRRIPGSCAGGWWAPVTHLMGDPASRGSSRCLAAAAAAASF